MKQAVSVALVALLILGSGSSPTGAGRPAAAAPGALSVKSDPSGADVYVDGRFEGRTPINLGQLPAGDHRVRLVKDGYLENQRVVSVGAGRAADLRVTLTHQVPAASPEAAGQVVRAPGGGVDGGGGSRLAKGSFLLGIAAGVGGAGGAAYWLLKNRRPTPGAIAVSPNATGMAGVTTFTFTAQGADDRNGDSLTYAWTFGDGASGSGQTVTHMYTSAGSFSAHLTVSDSNSSASPPDVTVLVAAGIAGTWTGGLVPGIGGASFSVTTSQSGSALTGSVSFNGLVTTPANPTVTGTVTPLTYPATVTFTTQAFTMVSPSFPPSFVLTFSGETNASGSAMIGTVITANAALSPPSQSATTTLSR
ncbi:MAG: hypothetical protein A3G76_12155 [Acidobacteria bacterium RIFCSPLOWO2_12_FULL_65_11]|nr:MAG: hypothetical protein A3G76_12155 [Acidobacteria bacterium RIFCSPLOWO2_12_FULL_65_11]